MSDFNANDVYHVKMERLSRSTYIPVAKGKPTDQWFYERARGQYLVELSRQPTKAAKDQFKSRCPKNRCISKTVAAKCVMAWSGYPYIVSKGLETNFVFFSDMVSKGEFPEPSEQSYIEMISRVILFNRCDDIIKNNITLTINITTLPTKIRKIGGKNHICLFSFPMSVSITYILQ